MQGKMHSHLMSIAPLFQPLNLHMGIVSASIDEVREAITAQLDSIEVGLYKSRESAIDWAEFFSDNGMIYNIMKAKIVIFQISENMTIYTSNYSDGWWTLYSNMIEDLFFDGYLFNRTLENKFNYHGFGMKIWKDGILDRNIGLIKVERGWEFTSDGDIAPFEDVNLYKRRRISDRLNQDSIEKYSKSSGYCINKIVMHSKSVTIFERC